MRVILFLLALMNPAMADGYELADFLEAGYEVVGVSDRAGFVRVYLLKGDSFMVCEMWVSTEDRVTMPLACYDALDPGTFPGG